MSEKEIVVPAARGDVGTVLVGTSNYSHPDLLSFSNRHLLTVFRIISGHPKGLLLSQIQDKAGFHRGNKENMARRKEILLCCEALTFYKYTRKESYKFFPTGKELIVSSEPRVFGADGLPRIRTATTATMPEYPRPA